MSVAVAVISGGMDSTVVAWIARKQFDTLHLVSFDYGQRHKIELEYAKLQAAKMKADSHIILDLSVLNKLMDTSALTNPDIEIPEGHYADETMRLTVVPNRNSIMLNIATALCVSKNAEALYTGVHAGDHSVYPDCRSEFINALTTTLRIANEGFVSPHFRIVAPFLHFHKSDIVLAGDHLGVDLGLTWSCYNGGHTQCGRCSTCVERKGAFLEADVLDPTPYIYDYNDEQFLRSILPDLTTNIVGNQTSKQMGVYDAIKRLGLNVKEVA